jgi:phosphopantothenoylcysteine decarboxylase/phosphopantothenate--cysteine ligase
MKILITAGPTREALGPVRFLSNRSTGRMGYAIADVAQRRGHEVRLISGPVAIDVPAGLEVSRVVSAAEMCDAVLSSFSWCDALVMSAAVADWRPTVTAPEKLKKDAMGATLELERTPDILMSVRGVKAHQMVVGFAAETENLLSEARRKLLAKRLDLIVANDVSRADAGFEVNTNAVTFVYPEGSEVLPLMSKQDVATHLLAWLEKQSHGGGQSLR